MSARPPRRSIARQLKKDSQLRENARAVESQMEAAWEVYAPAAATPCPDTARPLRAVAWNIERGKNLAAIRHVLQNHPLIRDADLIFLTEVDWGMARSGNRPVPKELGEALGRYAYFAPSYFNFTNGHGTERGVDGRNEFGLHGKAILSRFPLAFLRTVGMPNATNKLRAKEARLGKKRALVATLPWAGKNLTLACAHLDAFSSPAARAGQLSEVLRSCEQSERVLLAGDFNTNTLDSTSPLRLFVTMLKHVFGTGPRTMVLHHFPYPERRFDRPLFATLGESGFDFEACNESGRGTYDLMTNDRELGKMASDQFPLWLLKMINRQLEKSGGRVSLKLDWFATRNLKSLNRQVIPVGERDAPDLGRPSDHHPIYLEFSL